MTEPIQPNDYTSVIEIYTDPISVLQLETRGPQGPPGPPGVRFYDEFDPTRLYIPGDIVTYNGSLYFSSNQSVEGALPTDPLYWTRISYDGGSGPPTVPKFTALVPMGTVAEIEHNLGSEYVRVTVRDMSNKEVVYPGVNVLDPNHVELTFGYLRINPIDGTYHVTVERDS